jgi:hypothetical protein
LWVTGVVRAFVRVITLNRRVVAADAWDALVARTGILVVTVDRRIDAAERWITLVDRAEALIVAVNGCLDTEPGSGFTRVGGARIAIVTGFFHEHTARFGVAGVNGAGV